MIPLSFQPRCSWLQGEFVTTPHLRYTEKITAFFLQVRSKLLIIYIALCLWTRSKVEEKTPQSHNREWNHMLPESSPRHTCFQTPYCASPPRTQWLIPGAAAVPLFQHKHHTVSDIYTHIHTHRVLLLLPPRSHARQHIWLSRQSGQSRPLMFINWVCSWTSACLLVWWSLFPEAAEELWWQRADGSVVMFSPPAPRSGEPHFLMCHRYTSTAFWNMSRCCPRCHEPRWHKVQLLRPPRTYNSFPKKSLTAAWFINLRA